MNVSEKLLNLRNLMKDEGIDTYIITKFDPHQSEYIEKYYSCVQFISNFSGSAGTVVVTATEVGLWTDGRYYSQALNEIENTEIKLFRAADEGVISFVDYAIKNTAIGGVIGFFGKTISYDMCKSIIIKSQPKKIKLKTEMDLINKIWNNRPELSLRNVFTHDTKYCGLSTTEKLKMVREKMQNDTVDYFIISSLDDIAWLFNLRGSDLPHVCFFAAFAVISNEDAYLFIDNKKVLNIASYLKQEKITLYEYNDIYEFLRNFTNNVAFNPRKTSFSLYHCLTNCQKIELDFDYTTILKAVKNETEIKNLKEANLRDGVAIVRFIKWIKEVIHNQQITEFEAAQKLLFYRKDGENFLEESFSTIAAYMGNAAMAHYHCEKETAASLEPRGMLLMDSGGQYLDGTTDITRTISLGEISKKMQRDYTLVLKGHIAIASAKFLYGTSGANLDILARTPLWENGLNYNHGTGHGIGFCLSVHEGPQGISLKALPVPLEIGMLLSNEPGIYFDKEYGIRIENTILVQEHSKTMFGTFLKFETVSFIPFDLELIDSSMLSEHEISWINSYHLQVYEKLEPYLNNEEKYWLKMHTQSI